MMKIIDNIPRMQTVSKMTRKEGKSIGFVPTMGYLHDGHLSLVRAARKHTDIVVMSIFVNPLQFGRNEDYEKYPRDFKRDEALTRSAGVDVLFYPPAAEIYPPGYSTYVNVDNLSDVLCGKTRPGHFRGVATVVLKLFNIVKPTIAYFGQKDAQQAIIIKRMVEDLDIEDIEVKVMPIIRDYDGLALSSRNVYLSERERQDAASLYEALKRAEALIKQGERDQKKIVRAMEDIVKAKTSAKIDYACIVNTKNLKPAERISGELLIALAVYMGRTRLIDNIIIKV